jgi:hypothetical protein
MKVFNQFSNLGLGRQGLLYYTGKRRDVFTRATRQKRKRRVKTQAIATAALPASTPWAV